MKKEEKGNYFDDGQGSNKRHSTFRVSNKKMKIKSEVNKWKIPFKMDEKCCCLIKFLVHFLENS